jgi:hypothetical protein
MIAIIVALKGILGVFGRKKIYKKHKEILPKSTIRIGILQPKSLKRRFNSTCYTLVFVGRFFSYNYLQKD